MMLPTFRSMPATIPYGGFTIGRPCGFSGLPAGPPPPGAAAAPPRAAAAGGRPGCRSGAAAASCLTQALLACAHLRRVSRAAEARTLRHPELGTFHARHVTDVREALRRRAQ